MSSCNGLWAYSLAFAAPLLFFGGLADSVRDSHPTAEVLDQALIADSFIYRLCCKTDKHLNRYINHRPVVIEGCSGTIGWCVIWPNGYALQDYEIPGELSY